LTTGVPDVPFALQKIEHCGGLGGNFLPWTRRRKEIPVVLKLAAQASASPWQWPSSFP
jgi:hypothetical protein